MRQLYGAVIAVVLCTAVFGFAYPLLATGYGQLFFRNKSDGSLISVDGRVVGSRLAAEGFHSARYFHPRPSATTPPYNAAGTTFANLGPTNPDLLAELRRRARAIVALERPYNPGLTIGDVPVDAVTTSGSGIDPDISIANADLQAARVASVRGLSKERVLELIRANTDGRSLGFLGEPGVNVLELNLALDREART
jgi:K+-transporting ATPase ATPase C chain